MTEWPTPSRTSFISSNKKNRLVAERFFFVGLVVEAAAVSTAIVMTVEATVVAMARSRTLRTLNVVRRFVDELAMRDFDFAFFVEADDDNFEGVADFDDVGGVIDVLPIETANVAKAIAVAEEVHEGAIVFDAGNFAFEDFADLGFANDVIDRGLGLFNHLFLHVVEGDGSVVLDVDLDVVALGNDVIDDFAAGADHVADLIRIDVEGHHLRSVFADLFAGFRDSFGHDFADFGASLVRLSKGFGENFAGDTMDLDVHLKGGDAVLGSRALKSMSPKWSSRPWISVRIV